MPHLLCQARIGDRLQLICFNSDQPRRFPCIMFTVSDNQGDGLTPVMHLILCKEGFIRYDSSDIIFAGDIPAGKYPVDTRGVHRR